MQKQTITVANGDGIGPEIMDAVIRVLEAAGARLEYEHITVGESVYLSGNTAGISDESWKIIEKNKVLLKAPITTPQGGGYKSLNVTIRKTLGLYANVRPVRSFHPVVTSKSPKMDLVIIRENEEDLYAGIEYQQSPEVVLALKYITRPGTERIVRFGFEYAKATGRKHVTCMTKDNIMKLTDGLFHRIYDEVGQEYPDMTKDHWIIDIGMAKMADSPEAFELIILPNLYGDIASDVVAQISGSVGLAGSANIGDDYAMFEAIHGSAPRHAGKNMANPSGLLQGAIMMLVHLGQFDIAEKIENAWLSTLEARHVTYDLARHARELGDDNVTEVGTKEFVDAIIARLGQKPKELLPAKYGAGVAMKRPTVKDVSNVEMTLRGCDVYVHAKLAPKDIGHKLEAAAGDGFKLVMVSNRGQKVYPSEVAHTTLVDQYRCRFEALDAIASLDQVRSLLSRIEGQSLEWIKLENLYDADGQRAYSLGQGQ